MNTPCIFLVTISFLSRVLIVLAGIQRLSFHNLLYIESSPKLVVRTWSRMYTVADLACLCSVISDQSKDTFEVRIRLGGLIFPNKIS